MGVGEKRDVIMAIPGDVVDLPGAGEAAKLRGGFEEWRKLGYPLVDIANATAA